MTRNIDHSPFDTAQPSSESEDWLEDLKKGVELVNNGETARELSDLRKSLELRLVSLTIPQLEKRLESITYRLKPLIQERDLRQKASEGKDKVGLPAVNKKTLPIGVEKDVIHKLITQKEQQQAEVDRVASIEDVVVPVVEGSPSKEEAENTEMDRLVEENRSRSGDRIMSQVAREKELKIAQEHAKQVAAREEAKAHAYDVKSARTKQESFWGHVKRSWFVDTPESVKQDRRKQVAFDKRVSAQDKKRETIKQTHEDLAQYRVISARKGGSPTQEPSFFGKLWKNLSGQSRREERATTYRSNIEKVHGRLPDYRAGIGQDALRPKTTQKKETPDREEAA